jgi:proton glutamate symport protein
MDSGHEKKHISLLWKVILSIFLGIFLGLFFGPSASILKPIGDGYILLMELAVLPYIASSLIHGVGSLHAKEAKKIILKCGLFFLVLWSIAFVFIYALAVLMPNPQLTVYHDRFQPHFFSEEFFRYIVPQNPFYDLTNNVVPAIAIFGLSIGISTVFIPQKKDLLAITEKVNHAMEKFLLLLAKLAPISIVSHLANAFGTVDFKNLLTLELYVLSYIAVVLFIVFITFPILLKNCLHISFKEIIRETKTTALVAFATGTPSVALPFIHTSIIKLTEGKHLSSEQTHSTIETVIPIGFTFAQIGNAMILFFLFFLSFYYRQPFLLSEKVLISIITIPLSIGSAPIPSNAMNFLIEKLHFPQEAIDLFNEATAITDHFQVLCSVLSIFVFSLLALFSYHGVLRWNKKKLFVELLGSFALLFGVVGLLRWSIPFQDRYQNLYGNLTIDKAISNPVSYKIVRDTKDWQKFKQSHSQIEKGNVLAKIMSKGQIRVGYDPDNMPFSYWNKHNQLVGFDIANAFALARDLDASLIFLPVSHKELSLQLSLGYFDIAMTSMIVDEKRLIDMTFAMTYDTQNNILIVPQNKASDYLDISKIAGNSDLKIGGLSLYRESAQRHFPNSQFIPIENNEPLIEGKVDVIFSSYQYGLVWCLNHPDFVVVDYGGNIGSKFFAYPIHRGDRSWWSFINDWQYLKYSSNFEQEQEQYWFEGITTKEKSTRKGWIDYLF